MTSRSPDGPDLFAVLPYHDGVQGWAVGFRLTPPVGSDFGEWRCTEFMVQQTDSSHEPAISGSTVRALPIGELLAAVRREASDRRRRQGEVGDEVDKWLAPWREDRRGRSTRSDLDYALLALAYARLVERGDRSPALTLARRLGDAGKAATMGTRIGEARRRGMLTPVRRGEAGGEVTAKALATVAPSV